MRDENVIQNLEEQLKGFYKLAIYISNLTTLTMSSECEQIKKVLLHLTGGVGLKKAKYNRSKWET